MLDRDGFLVRELVSGKAVEKGDLSYDWDGRDDPGNVVVPDEAYSFKIDLITGGRTATYFPANAPREDLPIDVTYYDRRSGILAYKLPTASRVRIRAGAARLDPKTRKVDGPVLKTLVNREPRVAGSVIEFWSGLDASGTIRVPDLPNFFIAITATALPEDSVITIGNRTARFLDRARTRVGQSLLTHAVGGRRHPWVWPALDDTAPLLRLVPKNATWSSEDRFWTAEAETLRLSFSLDGPSADSFARQPGHLRVFLDQQLVLEIQSPKSSSDMEIRLAGLSPDLHVVALNWASDYGPVAVNSLRLKIGKADLSKAASKL